MMISPSSPYDLKCSLTTPIDSSLLFFILSNTFFSIHLDARLDSRLMLKSKLLSTFVRVTNLTKSPLKSSCNDPDQPPNIDRFLSIWYLLIDSGTSLNITSIYIHKALFSLFVKSNNFKNLYRTCVFYYYNIMEWCC